MPPCQLLVISPPHSSITLPSFLSHLSSSTHSKGPLMEKHVHFQTRKELTNPGQVSIDVLSDDVLLEILDFCLDQPRDHIEARTKVWRRLVQVCRRWRGLVFQSPRRLDLKILHEATIPVRETLDIWPTLPLSIWAEMDYVECLTGGLENVVAVLGHRDRICEIKICDASDLQLEAVLAMMQEPFPALTSLDLGLLDGTPARRIPDSFLGGFAPQLRCLTLRTISFPALPKLLLSATDLVILSLMDIPHSGYISPGAMVTTLSALTSLKTFHLRFQALQSRPGRESRHPPPSTRSVLPALTYIYFQGASEYLEDLVARIGAVPLLDIFSICFLFQPVFRIPHLSQFISRVPKFQALNGARVVISYEISVTVREPSWTVSHKVLEMSILDKDLGWQPSLLPQLYTSLPMFLTVEHLYMESPYGWEDYIGNTQWLELLRPFSAVKNLYLSKEFALCVARALQGLVGERVTEVLPALQNIFSEELRPSGRAKKAIEQFVYARRLSGHPIAVSKWERGG